VYRLTLSQDVQVWFSERDQAIYSRPGLAKGSWKFLGDLLRQASPRRLRFNGPDIRVQLLWANNQSPILTHVIWILGKRLIVGSTAPGVSITEKNEILYYEARDRAGLYPRNTTVQSRFDYSLNVTLLISSQKVYGEGELWVKTGDFILPINWSTTRSKVE